MLYYSNDMCNVLYANIVSIVNLTQNLTHHLFYYTIIKRLVLFASLCVIIEIKLNVFAWHFRTRSGFLRHHYTHPAYQIAGVYSVISS